MSLVNDALKRARLDAARQEAARRGLPLPEAVSGGTRISRRPWFALALALLALAAGALLFLAGRGSATRVAAGENQPAAIPAAASRAKPQSAEAPAKVAPETREEPAAGSPRLAPGPEPTSPPPSTPIRPQAAVQPVTPPPPRASPPPRPENSPAAGQPSPRAVAPEASAPGGSAPASRAEGFASQADRTYVGEVEVPGAGKIALEGIAWTEGRPFALINGRVVAPGERVAGLRVMRIAPKEVELQDDDGQPIVLRLR